MEHRLGRRVAVDFPVRLNLSFFGAQRGRVLDLSAASAIPATPVRRLKRVS